MKTATQTRAEIVEMEMAFQRMVQGDEFAEAEIIARHYLAHVNIAQQILGIIKSRERFTIRNERDENIREFLRHCVSLIKSGHAHDFGIELKWETFPYQPPRFPE